MCTFACVLTMMETSGGVGGRCRCDVIGINISSIKAKVAYDIRDSLFCRLRKECLSCVEAPATLYHARHSLVCFPSPFRE